MSQAAQTLEKDSAAVTEPPSDPAQGKQDVAVEFQVAATQLREINEGLRKRRLLREANTAPRRPGEDELKKLDSTVKRNSALVKKLRQVSEETQESLLDEIRRTNQSKYASEAVTALAEATLKPKDISAAVQVASLLHQRYADFGPDLAAMLVQSLSAKTSTDEERPSMAKRRSWLRLLGELQALGIAGDSRQLLKILERLAAADHERDKEAAHAALSILAAFAKAGREEYLGLPPHLPNIPQLPAEILEDSKEVNEAAESVARLQQTFQQEQSQRFALPSAEQEKFRQVAERAFDAACTALQKQHEALVEVEQQNLRALNNRGELPEDMAAHYEAQRRALDSLQKAAASLAETLDRKLPELQQAGTTRLKGTGGAIELISGRATAGTSGPFDDEETRDFYESLPDVRALVPAVLLSKGQDQKAEAASAQSSGTRPSSPKHVEAATDGIILADSLADTEQQSAPEEPKIAEQDSMKGQAEQPDARLAPELSSSEVRAEVEAVLRQLPTCTSKEAADEAALAFCYVNSKGARRRLVRVLMDDTQAALQQLQFYARIAAILTQVFPDVSSLLLQSLEEEFQKLQARRDSTQRTLEARLRNCRLIAELTKFRICPYSTFFTILKSLLDDFSGHNIDAAAALIETAGRFLFLLPETHQRLSNMLEVMMKLKNSRNVDSRQSLAVDSAYLTCKPPERATLRRSKRPPQELYMRHLVFGCVEADDIKQVTRKLRRFSWAESEPCMVRCLLSAMKGRFAQIPLLASLTASLSKYRPSLGVALADELLEEVRLSLETPETGKYQRRVAQMRLLGEMYNYRLMDSRTIFETLYLLLSSGHESIEDAEKYDPPSNYFRIRLVCVLLATCGQYFSKGSSAQKLDRFLLYFQRYLLYKPPLPLDVEFDIQELLEQLRPKLQRFDSFEDACAAVDELEAREAAKSAAGGGTSEGSDSEDERAESGSEGTGRRGEADEQEEEGADSDVERDLDPDEDEQVRLIQPIESAPPEVDEEFERELAALSMQRGSSLMATGGAPPPLTADSGSQANASATNTVAFKVMMRRGGRDDRSRAIQVPASLALAVKSTQDLAADAAERAEMKRLVLEASQRDQEGEVQARNQPKAPQQQQQQGAGGKGHGYYSRGGHSQAPASSAVRRGGGHRGRGRRYSASGLASVDETT